MRYSHLVFLRIILIQRTAHSSTSFVKHMSVDHSSLHIGMPQQFLDSADVVYHDRE